MAIPGTICLLSPQEQPRPSKLPGESDVATESRGSLWACLVTGAQQRMAWSVWPMCVRPLTQLLRHRAVISRQETGPGCKAKP